ncbi:MAG: N-acetylmuramoyl-L-alanine amidase, partial [Vibrionaceae bacterium]
MRQQRVLIGLLCWLGSSTLGWANSLDNIRVLLADGETRIVMDLAAEPTYSYFLLAKPDRLVVDLHNTDINTRLPIALESDPIIRKVRTSTPTKAGSSRLVIELKESVPARVVKLLSLNGNGHGVMIDLPHKKSNATAVKKTNGHSIAANEKPSSPPKLQTAVSVNAQEKKDPYYNQDSRDTKPVLTVASLTRELPSTSEPKVELPFGTNDIVIAIDPGHGGNDPGAVGRRGKYEKYVTLAIAKEIAKKLNAINGVRAVLTRTGDYYVGLNQRSAIARKQGAHLLISVHADGYHEPQP